MLLERFGHNDIVIYNLYNEIGEMKCVSSENEFFFKFVNELKCKLLQLENLGENTNSHILYALILKKLTDSIVQEVIHCESKFSRENQFSMMREILKSRVKNKRKIINLKRTGLCSIENQEVEIDNHEFSRTLSFTSNNFNKQDNCCFCGIKGHLSYKCLKIKSYKERIARLKELKLCFKCFSKEHIANNCKRKFKCFNCGLDHLKIMCHKIINKNFKNYDTNKELKNTNNGLINKNEAKDKVECVNVGIHKTFPVLLKCVKVKIINPQNSELSCEALALLDDGSTASYVSESLIKKLKLNTQKSQKLSIGVFNTPKAREIDSSVVKILIETIKKTKIEITANSVKFVTKPVPHILPEKEGKHKNLKGKIPNTSWGVPDLLIGSDFYYEFDLNVVDTLSSGFKLINSKLGLLVAGKSNNPIKNNNMVNSVITLNANLELETSISNYFSLESLGILEKPIAKNKTSILENISFNGDRFECNLPWRSFPPELPNNFGLSAGRLHSVVKKLKKNPNLLKKYDEIIKNQLKEEIIEKVSGADKESVIHYLPHQPVYREDKDKLRIVYDASSKSSTKVNSLNECLESGEFLLKNLAGILIRFRIPKVVVACDIQQAFLQIEIKREDRDATRFLWYEDVLSENEPKELQTFRFKRIAFGLTCSPFILNSVIVKHLKSLGDEISEELLYNLYVDNLLISTNNISDAKEQSAKVKEIFKRIKMNIREFISNKNEAINDISSEDKLIGNNQKFLGIKWDTNSDQLKFELNAKIKQKISKRSILSKISSHFDPLSLLAPIFLPAKLMLQKLWNEKISWDDELNEKFKDEWNKISFKINVNEISVERYLSNTEKNSELHIFVDASMDAFACCAYWVRESKSDLIFSKCRVKPLKLEKISIHKLELLACLIGVRAIKFVREELKKGHKINLEKIIYLWSDSSTVLHWLQSSVKQEIFIEN